MQSLRLTTCCILFFVLSIGQICHAEDDENNIFSFSGFATLGVAHSNTNQADITRNILQPTGVGYTRSYDFGIDSLLGAQLNFTPSGPVDAVIQLVSHRRDDDSFQPELTWAYLRYNPNDNLQLRAGRLGFDVYLLADTQNIGYSYLWVRPPIEFFGILPVTHIDGTDIVYKKNLDSSLLKLKAFVGVAREQVPLDPGFFSFDKNPIAGVYAEYQSDNWVFRLGQVQMRFKNDLPYTPLIASALNSPLVQALDPEASSFANNLSYIGKKVSYSSFGMSYSNNPFQAQFMLSQSKSNTISFATLYSGYATLGYRVKDWTPYLTFSRAHSVNVPINTGLPLGISPAIDELSSDINLLIAKQKADQSTWSLGVRYDIKEKMAIKFQVDRLTSKEYFLQPIIQPGWNGKAIMTTVVVDFVF